MKIGILLGIFIGGHIYAMENWEFSPLELLPYQREIASLHQKEIASLPEGESDEKELFIEPDETLYKIQCDVCFKFFVNKEPSVKTIFQQHYRAAHKQNLSLSQRTKMMVRPLTESHYFAQCPHDTCDFLSHSRGYQMPTKKLLTKHIRRKHSGARLYYKSLQVNIRKFIKPEKR